MDPNHWDCIFNKKYHLDPESEKNLNGSLALIYLGSNIGAGAKRVSSIYLLMVECQSVRGPGSRVSNIYLFRVEWQSVKGPGSRVSNIYLFRVEWQSVKGPGSRVSGLGGKTN